MNAPATPPPIQRPDAAGTPHHEQALLIDYLSGHDAPCPRCGFNLRGNTLGRCPECGFPVRLSLQPERRLSTNSIALGVQACGLTSSGVVVAALGLQAALSGRFEIDYDAQHGWVSIGCFLLFAVGLSIWLKGIPVATKRSDAAGFTVSILAIAALVGYTIAMGVM